MKINWFSPLGPSRTDIAHYTLRVLKPLCRLAEVTLWSDRPQWDHHLEQFAAVRYYEPSSIDWRELNRADATFYHMGNNVLFHGSIWQVSLQHPGIVVLHDFRFHHFFVEYYCSQGNQPQHYLQAIEDEYGSNARAEADELLRTRLHGIDLMAERYPMTRLVLRNAIGALTHSREPFQLLSENGELPVSFAPLPYPSVRTQPDSLQTVSRASRNGRRHLVVFGYLAPNRRLEQLFEALGTMPEVDSFQLDVFGDLWDKKRVLECANKFNLTSRVNLHGFVPDEDLDRALSAADVAVNLRYPTMGEASGSQLRCWANGLASIVTRVGWYATLPEDLVAFVRPESEIADIQAHLRELILNPSKFAAMGERGRRLLGLEHSTECYARSIVDLAGRAASYRVRAAALKLADRTGKKLADLGPAAVRSNVPHDVAREILNLMS
jgi:glycosyltransferase involved in cell wall biosynthesis